MRVVHTGCGASGAPPSPPAPLSLPGSEGVPALAPAAPLPPRLEPPRVAVPPASVPALSEGPPPPPLAAPGAEGAASFPHAATKPSTDTSRRAERRYVTGLGSPTGVKTAQRHGHQADHRTSLSALQTENGEDPARNA